MPRRHPLPRVWLMTDERMGDSLWTALRRLPRGGGVVFRHYGTPLSERRRMFAKVVRIARSRGLLVLRAGEAVGYGSSGRHGPGPRRSGLVGMSVHDLPELCAARLHGADIVFVSPLFATRSHPGASSLSVVRAAAIVRAARVPAIALGGMSARRFRQVRQLGFHGWAAIDAWAGQKRKAVPI